MADKTITLFRQLGVEIEPSDDQAVGDCPFCGKPSHLFVSLVEKERPGQHKVEPGFWDCKSCGESGGPVAFIQKIYEIALADTSDSDYLAIAKDRGIPKSAFKRDRLAFDGRIGKWLIPIHNLRGQVSSLGLWEPGSPIIGLAGRPAGIFNLHALLEDQTPVYLCEGYWDKVALDWLLRKLKEPGVVVAVPGAGTFKTPWASHFAGRTVYLCYDADNPGRKGQSKVANILAASPKPPSSITPIQWPESVPDGYDIRDLISKNRQDPSGVFNKLHEELLRGQIPKAPPPTPIVACSDFESVVAEYRTSGLHLSPRLVDAIALAHAVTLSTRLHGEPLWMFLIAPPGGAKTTILRSFESATDWCEFRSQITPAALVAGINDDYGEDPSLILALRGRTLILKDYTEFLTMPAAMAEQIYGILRGAYDGRVDRQFARRLRVYEDVYFSMLAGVTHAIHRDQRAALGERFLKYEMIPYEDIPKQEHAIKAAINQQTAGDGTNTVSPALRGAVQGFLSSREIPERPPALPSHMEEKIVGLVQVIAYLRATVARSGHEREMVYRPTPELGTRLSKQLVKLAQSLAIVYGLDRIDEKCYRVIQQVALDSAIGWNLEVVQHLASNPEGCSTSFLKKKMQLSKTIILKRLEDLQELQAVESFEASNNSGNRGAYATYWKLSDHICELWERAELGRLKPIKAPARKGGPK